MSTVIVSTCHLNSHSDKMIKNLEEEIVAAVQQKRIPSNLAEKIIIRRYNTEEKEALNTLKLEAVNKALHYLHNEIRTLLKENKNINEIVFIMDGNLGFSGHNVSIMKEVKRRLEAGLTIDEKNFPVKLVFVGAGGDTYDLSKLTVPEGQEHPEMISGTEKAMQAKTKENSFENTTVGLVILDIKQGLGLTKERRKSEDIIRKKLPHSQSLPSTLQMHRRQEEINSSSPKLFDASKVGSRSESALSSYLNKLAVVDELSVDDKDINKVKDSGANKPKM